MTFFESLLAKDARYSNQLRLEPKKNMTWWIAVFFAHSGDSWFWVLGLGLIWLFGNPEWHDKSMILAISIVLQALIVFAIKFSIKRRRPEGEWGDIYRKTDPHSFPSGHATRAFLLVAMGIGLGPAWFGWMLVVWAPLVCLARIMLGVHYISDILAGMLLGLSFGWIMLQIYPHIARTFPFLFLPIAEYLKFFGY
ncbi:MAG: phosphatase PAP2 family protein [Anaerolineaceae bacterium]|nr:phosphatase PAP2 family protein [Anaerolineaceae bacterium]